MGRELVTERAQLLLKSLVERYIREGHPVGSRSLLEESKLSISPATVRSVMSDLEDLGLVSSPHTSAGRVPTTQGYRLFVDSLITMQPIAEQAIQSLEVELDPNKSPSELAYSASHLLSTITSQAGLVTMPRAEKLSLRQIEFLPLSGHRVLVILVINEREVQNRVLHTSRQYTDVELQQATTAINQRFAGHSLSSIRRCIVLAMDKKKEPTDHYMQSTHALAPTPFESCPLYTTNPPTKYKTVTLGATSYTTKKQI